MEKDRYKKIPISDNHMHLWKEMKLSNTVKFNEWIMEEFGYETITLNAFFEQMYVPRAYQPNLKIMYLKKLYPDRVYCHAGFRYSLFSPDDDGEYFLNQAKYYKLCGYDGIKMLYNFRLFGEGFPYMRISDSRYDKLFEYMEREQFPIIIHIGAPEVCFGDINEVPESQKKWHAGDCDFHLYDMLDDFRRMMDKFPKLRVTVAHFGFITWHPDWAEEWLTKYENLYFDLKPSLFMFFDFQEKPDVWKKFFFKYQDRIIYGTDTGSNTMDEKIYEPAALCHVVRGFFEETEPFSEFDEMFYPMPLPDDILRKFYKGNMLRFRQNKAPLQGDFERLKKEFEVEESMDLTELSKENLEIMKKEFMIKKGD